MARGLHMGGLMATPTRELVIFRNKVFENDFAPGEGFKISGQYYNPDRIIKHSTGNDLSIWLVDSSAGQSHGGYFNKKVDLSKYNTIHVTWSWQSQSDTTAFDISGQSGEQYIFIGGANGPVYVGVNPVNTEISSTVYGNLPKQLLTTCTTLNTYMYVSDVYLTA